MCFVAFGCHHIAINSQGTLSTTVVSWGLIAENSLSAQVHYMASSSLKLEFSVLRQQDLARKGHDQGMLA